MENGRREGHGWSECRRIGDVCRIDRRNFIGRVVKYSRVSVNMDDVNVDLRNLEITCRCEVVHRDVFLES